MRGFTQVCARLRMPAQTTKYNTMKFRKIIGSVIFGVIISCGVSAQELTRVRGTVTDAETGEPVSLASIVFTGTQTGASTNKEGVFSLETREDVSEIRVTSVSYEPQTVIISRGAFNTTDIKLSQKITQIEAVRIVPGKNPAHAILDSVMLHKPENDPSLKESYQYGTYTKMDLSVANKEKFRNKRMQKNFGFIFDYLDTSAVTGRAYLPVMISESTTDYYYRKRPQLEREIIKASRISGVEDYNFAQFTGALYVDVNVYDNYINLFEVNIPSPLCEHGRAFYEYTLMDRFNYGGRQTYLIRFEPKNLASPVFDGEIYIDASDWALRSCKMKLARGINVNWLRDLYIENHNEIVEDGSTWFKKRDRIIADFSFTTSDSSKLISMMAQRQIEYEDVKVNVEIPEEIVRRRTNLSVTPDILNNDEEFWAGVRPYELTERELNIYNMVDSIQHVPLYNSIYDFVNTVIIGYKKAGPVEIGSIYKLYSFNKLEGSRFQLGIRTNADFSRRVRIGGYGAYGTKDSKLKGGMDIEYRFGQHPFSKMTISGQHDVLQLSSSSNILASGNLLSSIFARGDTEKLVMMNKLRIQQEQEWLPGFENTLAIEWRELKPTRYVEFNNPDGTRLSRIRSSEVILNTRLSRDEMVHYKPFDKIHMYSTYPVLNLELAAGFKDVFDSSYEYYRTVLNIYYKFNIPPIGRSYLDVTGGKIFGKVPYPLLKMHEGNATYFNDKSAFSCMNFYEFTSDIWASVMYEHHFRGFFLGRIPLMKRLKWREVFTCKMLWGSLSDKNNGSKPGHMARMDFPEGMSSVSKPYIETGVGIENIFHFMRIDAVWRITHRENRSSKDNFAMNFSMHFDF